MIQTPLITAEGLSQEAAWIAKCVVLGSWEGHYPSPKEVPLQGSEMQLDADIALPHQPPTH